MVRVRHSLFLALPSAGGTDWGTATFPHQPASLGVSEQAASPQPWMSSRKSQICAHAINSGVSSFPSWGHSWGQMPQCHHGAQQGLPPPVGRKGSPPVPTVSCAHAGRDMHSANPLCPVAPIPHRQGYVWLHRTLQVGTCMTPSHPVPTHDPDRRSPPCRQGHGRPQPPSAPWRCVPQAGRDTSGPGPLVSPPCKWRRVPPSHRVPCPASKRGHQ